MNCARFDGRLDALLEGRCTATEWAEAEAHLAACPKCRRLFDAMSGRAGDLDDEGHEALAASVVAKTSGSGRACESARERLCAFVDGELQAFDRELVEGHLSRCAACSVLAAALADQAQVLPTFTALAPRHGFVGEVLAATSRRQPEPSVAEKITAWLGRVSQRPRFSVEVAYVMTVLLLVILGNPVAAFREASVRVQPRVSAVAVAVAKPLSQMRAAGAERLSSVERVLSPRPATPGVAAALGDGLVASGIQWLESRIVAPLQTLAAHVGSWAWNLFENVRRAFVAPPTEPPATGVR
jgi:predicted anti-sigma-YlaC factor YlaD